MPNEISEKAGNWNACFTKKKNNRYDLNRFCFSKYIYIYIFMACAKLRKCKACLYLEEFPQEKLCLNLHYKLK